MNTYCSKDLSHFDFRWMLFSIVTFCLQTLIEHSIGIFHVSIDVLDGIYEPEFKTVCTWPESTYRKVLHWVGIMLQCICLRPYHSMIKLFYLNKLKSQHVKITYQLLTPHSNWCKRSSIHASPRRWRVQYFAVLYLWNINRKKYRSLLRSIFQE